MNFNDKNDSESLNLSFNEYLTEVSNSYYLKKGRILGKKLKQFLRIAWDINVIEHNTFTFLDFPSMTKGNFQQYVNVLLKDYVETKTKTRPQYYRLKGIVLDDLTNRESIYDISIEWDRIVKKCKEQPPAFHNIRVETYVSLLYPNYLKFGKKPQKNGQITIKIPSIDNRFDSKVTVFPKGRIYFFIGCTHDPLPYSPAGFNDLIEYLTKVILFLMSDSETDFKYSPVRTWRLSYFHFNKDFKFESPVMKYTIDSLQEHSRVYLHRFPDGSHAYRIEEDVSPKTTIEEEQEKSRILEHEQKSKSFYDDSTVYPVNFKRGSEFLSSDEDES